MAVHPGFIKGNDRAADDGRALADGGEERGEGAAGLVFDVDEQPTISLHGARSPAEAEPRGDGLRGDGLRGDGLRGDGLIERTDLPITSFPKPETRRLPFGTRLRLLWHRQILRDARH